MPCSKQKREARRESWGEDEEFISRYVEFEVTTGLTFRVSNGQLKLGLELKRGQSWLCRSLAEAPRVSEAPSPQAEDGGPWVQRRRRRRSQQQRRSSQRGRRRAKLGCGCRSRGRTG